VFTLPEIAWMTFSFCIINILSLSIFFIGQKKELSAQPFYTMVSIVLKFLMELALALIWFLIAKKTTISFIILFFVLYLTFTLISIFVILNTLKKKSL
jgi:hypothetical protein